ncbi:MAG TPA: LuxR C-terminal-related transcriptional regulator [Streptosporangiaceae bacterium]|nr:LuxR C-terminal-related transcriptional regulator [Streptosporangiaceae bacterium]
MATYAAEQVAPPTGRTAASAGIPILTSKITVPGVPDWTVPRPRITKLIADGTRCPLTVVTGPPGAGKTMALALWAAAESGPVAWVSLDDYDNQPGVFWAYVAAALRRCGAAMPRALSAAARGRAADHAFLPRLASALAAQNPPVTLVIDDLHLLTEPAVRDELDFVLRNVGPGLRVVISARADPLLPLHRYRLAGDLAEVRAGDLAFSTAEAGLLMAQHGCALSAESLECLTRRTEGWAAGLRLAAISMDSHPDPDQFVKELITEDSALTGYLLEEVLSTQPPEVRDVLLSTSILEQVSVEAASELTGDERAGAILSAVAHANAFIQPAGDGWYRYQTLFAEVLRLKLRHEHPGRITVLHRRAARWYERNGSLPDAVRHAAQAADWPLAASMVIGGLAINEIIEPRGGRSLAAEFVGMPHSDAWPTPQPYLISAAAALAAGRPESAAAALDAAEGILERSPAGQEAAVRLAAAVIRLAAARRTGDLPTAAAAASRARRLVSEVAGAPGEHDGKPVRHRQIQARVLADCAAVELWSGHLDEAARVLEPAVAAAAAPGGEHERAACLGQLALVEALRGRLRRAVKLATEATAASAADEQQPLAQRPPSAQQQIPAQHQAPAALAALAWVHLERGELREARGRLRQVDAALGVSPDKLIGAVACLMVAWAGLAEGRADVATQFVARARSGWSVPAWLGQGLSLAESRACVAAGDTRAALAAAERLGRDAPLAAAVALAHARAVAGDGADARRALAPALAAGGEAPDRVRLQAWLVDARLSYGSGDGTRGRRSLTSALRLAEREEIRLPFVMERGWIGPLLRRDPELARTHRRLFTPALREDHPAAPPGAPERATMAAVEPLTEREREVLRHVSGMLNTAEVASEMYISVNTVKSHLKSIYRKLAAGHRGEAVRRARQLELI